MSAVAGGGRVGELCSLLTELLALRLRPQDWEAIDGHLATVDPGAPAATPELAQLVFEARVRGRFSGGRTDAAVVPTKQTTVLPWVGLVCAAMLVGVGALLGGGVILAAIVGLGVFVFGIALAGSRVAHRDVGPAVDDGPGPVPVPPAVAARITALCGSARPGG